MTYLPPRTQRALVVVVVAGGTWPTSACAPLHRALTGTACDRGVRRRHAAERPWHNRTIVAVGETGVCMFHWGLPADERGNYDTKVRQRTCEGSRGTVGSAVTRQPAAAARRSQARCRARPVHDAGCTCGHTSAPPRDRVSFSSGRTAMRYLPRRTPLRLVHRATVPAARKLMQAG